MTEDERMKAFIRLFTSHEARLSAFAMALIPNWADADDVLQQTNLTLWVKFDQFDLNTNFFAWAGRILYLEAKALRKKQLRSKVIFSDEFFDTIARKSDELSEDLMDRQRVLGECIARLKQPQRELLRMRYEDGGNIQVIAQSLGRSTKASYSALGGIRKVLVDCVDRRLKREFNHGL